MLPHGGLTLRIANLKNNYIGVGNKILEGIEEEPVHFRSLSEIKTALTLERKGQIEILDEIPEDILELLKDIPGSAPPPSPPVGLPAGLFYRDEFMRFKAELDKQLKQVDGELAQMPKKTDVFLKEKGININDWDEPTRKAFLEAQGIDVNYVLGERNVKPLNTTFFNKGKNLFFSEWEVGDFNDAGANIPSSEFSRTRNFLGIEPNTSYTLSFSGLTGVNYYLNYYDANKNFLSRVTLGTLNVHTIRTPANAAFVRLKIYKMGAGGVGLIPSTSQMELGTASSPYVPAEKMKIDPSYIGDLSPENTAFFIKRELFKGTWKLDGREGAKSELIEVSPNTEHTVKVSGIDVRIGGVAFYIHFHDAATQQIDRIVSYSSGLVTFTTPPSTKYVSFSTYKAGANSEGLIPTSTQLEQGGTISGKVNNSLVFDSKYIEKEYRQGLNDLVKVIAHRGYSSTAPENTLPAYILAKENGFSYVECDVKISKDGVPVVIHDDTINRTSNGTGNVLDYTVAQLKEFDFGAWKSPEYAGTKIPTLEEFVILCKRINLHPYIEFKIRDLAGVRKSVDIVRKLGMLRNVTWLGWDENLPTALSEDPKARVGFLYPVNEHWMNYLNNMKTQYPNADIFINTNHEQLTKEQSDLCAANNLTLEVFTCDDQERIKWLSTLAVSGISTNYKNVAKIFAESV